MSNLTVQSFDNFNDITNTKTKQWHCIDSNGKRFVVDWNADVNGLYPSDNNMPEKPEAMAFWCDWKFRVTDWDELAVSYLACPDDAFQECVRIMREKGLIA